MRLDSEQLDLLAQARVGTTVKGKWHLDRLIGVGGMAAVYAATHRNRKKAALKILHLEYSAQEAIRERFLREGYVANSVGHGGIVKIDDDDVTEDGAAFLVMELVEGETLEERLTREGPLPADEVLSYMDQVLDALAVAHAKGVVHRDLKPDNMLLSKDGRVKLLDFGIARVRELTTDPTRTLTDGLLGTPAFMPPEQARGSWAEVDAKSDLWSLGATMFTLLTGCYVHDAETATETLVVAIAQRAPKLKELRPDLPAALCKVVDRALEYEKSARWPTATIMRLAVRQARNELEASEVEAKRELALSRAARASDPEIEVSDSESARDRAFRAAAETQAASTATHQSTTAAPEPATTKASQQAPHDAQRTADEQPAAAQSENQSAPAARLPLPSDDELTVVRPNPLPLASTGQLPQSATAREHAATSTAQSSTTQSSTAQSSTSEPSTSEPSTAQPTGAVHRSLSFNAPVCDLGQVAPTHDAVPDAPESASTSSFTSNTPPPNSVPSRGSNGSTVSIAASLILAAVVIVGVTWVVQRQKDDGAGAHQAPLNATLHAAQARPQEVVAPPAAPPAASASTATPKRPDTETPSAEAGKAETVALEELPVLPLVQAPLPPSPLEQAKEETKRELSEGASIQGASIQGASIQGASMKGSKLPE